MSSSAPPRALTAPVLLAALLTLVAACSGDDEPSATPSDAGTDEQLVSGPDDAFQVVEHDGASYVVGHRVLVEIPSDWAEYAPETPTPDRKALVWSVGEPATTRPAPAGLQLEVPAARNATTTDPLQRSLTLMEITPRYRLIDSGEAVVPGALAAEFHRFENQIEVGGRRVTVERLNLFLNTGQGTWSTVRFIAPAGRFDEPVNAAYESVRLTKES